MLLARHAYELPNCLLVFYLHFSCSLFLPALNETEEAVSLRKAIGKCNLQVLLLHVRP